MKIKPEHYEHIKNELSFTINNYGMDIIMSYKQKLIDGEIKCNDVNVRLMYDLQRNAGLTSFVCNTLYEYSGDSHYETALLKAGRELKVID